MEPVSRRQSARKSCMNTGNAERIFHPLFKSCISTCGKRRSDVDADKTSVFEVVIDSLELGRFRQAPHPIRQVRRRPTYPSHVLPAPRSYRSQLSIPALQIQKSTLRICTNDTVSRYKVEYREMTPSPLLPIAKTYHLQSLTTHYLLA